MSYKGPTVQSVFILFEILLPNLTLEAATKQPGIHSAYFNWGTHLSTTTVAVFWQFKQDFNPDF